MKKLIYLLVVPMFTSLFFACGSDDKSVEQQEALLKEVYVIHDGVMPRMSEIVKLKGNLIELTVDSLKAPEVKAAISQLEKAEEGMMDWMNKFQQPAKLRETKKHEEVMAYLEGEKVVIAQVRDAMVSSIENAERLLQELQTQAPPSGSGQQ